MILGRSAGQIEIPGRGYKPISDIRRRHIGSLISTMTTNNDQEEKSRRRWPNQGTDREKGSEKRKNEPETCRRQDLLGRRRPWR